MRQADVDKSGADVSRTRDLIIANDALYQLSYRPIQECETSAEFIRLPRLAGIWMSRPIGPC